MFADPQKLAEAENDPVVEDWPHVLLPASQGSSRTGKEVQHRVALTKAFLGWRYCLPENRNKNKAII
jgi:hypothetical protein